ncbi:hypothetical protein B0T16DRAFT_315487 [Cercophora newfieldiana]|uniref:Golgi apparatus membrane protein TVP38 n=1 Tax=Cercophora newfieldiana TaxID=92897 RepID=A0AA40D008_9PEZI|nr:hypothetical protein B0T16DRAFT_315487 [Cercophora newfieldiana]
MSPPEDRLPAPGGGFPRAASPASTTTSSKPPSSPRVSSPAAQTSLPPWARRPSARRLSMRRSPYSAAQQEPPFHTRLLRGAVSLGQQTVRLFNSLSPAYQLLVLVGGIVAFVLGVLALVYSHRIFAWLGPIAKTWRELPGGWILVWLLTFMCAFPPMIGYSTAVTISGFVFGFPWGWPIVATATVAGSTAAFFTSRGVFSGYVHRLVGKDHRFVALGQVLRRDGLGVLAMIRFCPLPYSLSNGFLATVPSIRPWGFAAATACATPKLAVHVFIGSRLALLAESGDKMSGGDRAINYASMAFGGLLGFVVGLVIYRRTVARAAEIAATEALENGEASDDTLPGDDLGDGDGYADGENSRLMRGNPADMDAATLMDDDDISLWEADGVEDDGYRDWDEEATVGGAGKKSNGSVNGLRR